MARGGSIQKYEAFGVQFRRSQLIESFPTLATESSKSPARVAGSVEKSVSEAELSRWAKTYLPAHPGLVHDQIAEAAQTKFAGRKVTRDPLRVAIKSANYPVSRGKPSRK